MPMIAQTPDPEIPKMPMELREEDLEPINAAARDQGYNFITDPCCCCPVSWARTDGDADDVFKFS
jgi:hypothetical protein